MLKCHWSDCAVYDEDDPQPCDCGAERGWYFLHWLRIWFSYWRLRAEYAFK